MTEERLCVLCAIRGRRPEHYEQPQACPGCRVWLAGVLRDIERLWLRLADDLAEPDGPWKVRQLREGHWKTEPGHDPVSASMPTAARGAATGGDQVSGSREAPVPVNLDAIDLSAGVTGLTLTAHGRQWWMDQTGQLSVAMVLDLTAREWAEARGHRLPVPTVPELTDWLGKRLDWACDRYPGIDADAIELSRLRSVLRNITGEVEPRPEHMGAPCPTCDLMTLIRRPGEDKVECANEDCRRVLTGGEYARWARLTAADIQANPAAWREAA